MEYVEIVEMFNNSSNGSYEHGLANFAEYIQNSLKMPLNLTTLGAIRTDHVIKSIDYCIKHKGFNSKSIAQKYSIGISQFFKYSISAEYFSNKDFYD